MNYMFYRIFQIEEERKPLNPKPVDSGIPIPCSASTKATPGREFYYTYLQFLYTFKT